MRRRPAPLLGEPRRAAQPGRGGRRTEPDEGRRPRAGHRRIACVRGVFLDLTGGIWWRSSPGPPVLWRRCPMPWYWTDELARALLTDGRIDPETAARLGSIPVAVRRDEATL